MRLGARVMVSVRCKEARQLATKLLRCSTTTLFAAYKEPKALPWRRYPDIALLSKYVPVEVQLSAADFSTKCRILPSPIFSRCIVKPYIFRCHGPATFYNFCYCGLVELLIMATRTQSDGVRYTGLRREQQHAGCDKPVAAPSCR